MVERFVLPESGPCAAQNLVGYAAGPSFEPPHNGGHCGIRLKDYVDVIGHDNPRVEFVGPAIRLTVQECIHNHVGDSRILQPSGAGPKAVQLFVLHEEVGRSTGFRRQGAG
jgi:hypothetical protein